MPYINKIVLQSPWDGHVPAFLRGLIHVPLMLRVFKPWDMAGIKSVSALKQILLGLDEKVDYRESMSTFAQAVSGHFQHSSSSKKNSTGDKNSVEAVGSKSETDTEEETQLGGAETVTSTNTNTSTSSATTTDASPTALDVSDLAVELQKEGGLHCPVLIITGTRELPFELTGRRIAKYVHRTYNERAASNPQTLTDPDTSSPIDAPTTPLKSSPKSSTPTCFTKKPAYLHEPSNVQVKICKYAGHMSFVKKKNGTYVRSFFQREIVSFIVGEDAVAVV